MSNTAHCHPGSLTYLGATVYHWGILAQRNLLSRGFRRWLDEAIRARIAVNGWFCRYDARGPHVFALLQTTGEYAGSLRSYLESQITDYLLKNPSSVSLEAEELRSLHAGCRGRTMSIADRSPGLAENNSFTVFEHPPESYPLSMGFNEIDKACLWDVISSVSHCVLNHIEDEPVEAAVRWITSFDRLFGEDTISAETYWAYHAASLLVGRDHDTWRDRADLLKPRVAKLLSVPTRRRLDEIWSSVLVPGESAFDIVALRKVIEQGTRPDRQLALLREISHSAIGQIGLNGKQEVPLVLYAWSRHFTA